MSLRLSEGDHMSYCTNCGTVNPDWQNFCSTCGSAVGTMAPTISVQPGTPWADSPPAAVTPAAGASSAQAAWPGSQPVVPQPPQNAPYPQPSSPYPPQAGPSTSANTTAVIIVVVALVLLLAAALAWFISQGGWDLLTGTPGKASLIEQPADELSETTSGESAAPQEGSGTSAAQMSSLSAAQSYAQLNEFWRQIQETSTGYGDRTSGWLTASYSPLVTASDPAVRNQLASEAADWHSQFEAIQTELEDADIAPEYEAERQELMAIINALEARSESYYNAASAAAVNPEESYWRPYQAPANELHLRVKELMANYTPPVAP